MKVSEHGVRDLITQEAADWLVANREGLNGEQRREFSSWLKASPRHVEEYLALAALERDFPAACESTHQTLEELLASARLDQDSTVHELGPHSAGTLKPSKDRWVLALAASVLALGVGLFIVSPPWQSRFMSSADATVQHFQTRHGELKTQRLADQSVLHLNTDTSVTVRLGAHERVVVLDSGEAAFEVAHDSSRPFRVSAGPAQLVAVGTQFDVRRFPDATLVTVSEGSIKVGLSSSANHSALPLPLSAGQQMRVTEHNWPARVASVNVDGATAWLQGRIQFDNVPLAGVIQEINRYASTPLEIVTPALSDLKISGDFATADVGTFITFLRSVQGVQVEVTATQIRIMQR